MTEEETKIIESLKNNGGINDDIIKETVAAIKDFRKCNAVKSEEVAILKSSMDHIFPYLSELDVNFNITVNLKNKQDKVKAVEQILSEGLKKLTNKKDMDEVALCIDVFADIGRREARHYARNLKLDPDLSKRQDNVAFETNLRNYLWNFVRESEEGFFENPEVLISKLHEQTTKFFKKEIVDYRIKTVEQRFKGLKLVGGVAVAVLTIIPTSYVLNWIYPRFMETFLPELSKTKKGGVK